ncbi:antitoxin VbhA family protein [Paraburkholderia sp. BR10872]|uniref:antitoxin VbhA family protein n=1 Tax=Paraburkholderia sp. BR10872 TaxID=3236989 RepID=UPI0034D19008
MMDMSKLMKSFEERKGAYYDNLLDEEEFKRQFNKRFEQINASWAYEGMELDEQGKQLVFECLTGKITQEEFAKRVKELIS